MMGINIIKLSPTVCSVKPSFKLNKEQYQARLQLKEEADKYVADLDDLATLALFCSLPFLYKHGCDKKWKASDWIGAILLGVSFISLVVADVKKYNYLKRRIL